MILQEIIGIWSLQSSNLNFNTLPKLQIEIFNNLANLEWISRFYLAGGTAIALRLGHRKSYDFDFFTNESIHELDILHELSNLGKVKIITQTDNIIHCFLDDFEVSFFKVKYPLLFETENFIHLKIASLTDLLLMKLQAISGRGTRKDFVDLYYLLKIYELGDISHLYEQKYGIKFQSDVHLHKALVYFVDAEKRAMPQLFDNTKWDDIKKEIIYKVVNINNFYRE